MNEPTIWPLIEGPGTHYEEADMFDRTDAAEAMDRRLKRGWTTRDIAYQGLWYFPSERRLWNETGDAQADRAVIAQRPDAIRVIESGCPKCLTGYADILSDPMFHCELCEGTGIPVFGDAG